MFVQNKHSSELFDINKMTEGGKNMDEETMVQEEYVPADIEVVEIVCQNTPDWTHGSGC